MTSTQEWLDAHGWRHLPQEQVEFVLFNGRRDRDGDLLDSVGCIIDPKLKPFVRLEHGRLIYRGPAAHPSGGFLLPPSILMLDTRVQPNHVVPK